MFPVLVMVLKKEIFALFVTTIVVFHVFVNKKKIVSLIVYFEIVRMILIFFMAFFINYLNRSVILLMLFLRVCEAVVRFRFLIVLSRNQFFLSKRKFSFCSLLKYFFCRKKMARLFCSKRDLDWLFVLKTKKEKFYFS